MSYEILVRTKERYDFVDITEKIEEIIQEDNINQGCVFIFAPHSTAAILLTENEDNLKKDFFDFFQKLVSGLNFYHNRIDDNADSHLLSALIGQGKILPIKDGKILRGTWQNIFLVEFDGPRERKIVVQTIK